jgi:hypothetical protein
MKISLLIVLITLMGCSFADHRNNEGLRPSATAVFQDYLIKQFNDSIGEAPHYYVLVPKFGCMGCMQRTLIYLQSLIDEGRQDAFTYVVSNEKMGLWSIFEHGKQQVYVDSTGHLDRLNLGIIHVTIVVTQADSVHAIHSISPQKLDSLASYFHFP